MEHRTPSTQKSAPSPPRKLPKLDLPFSDRKTDWGTWAYEHRVGLCFMVMAYLLFGIVFVSVQIMVTRNDPNAGFLIELAPDEIPQTEKPLTPEERRMLESFSAADFSDIKNRSSNLDAALGEGSTAALDANLKDAKGTAAADIYNEGQALQDKLNSSRELYEKGLREEAAMRRGNKSQSDNSNAAESRSKGKVTVSYTLTGREAVYLHVPAYTCRGGGEVTISITVNRNGSVVGTSVDKSNSSSDPCLTDMALKAASASRFNVDGNAKERQQGTIFYVFIPQ